MFCTFQDAEAKTFAKAVHTLSKIGNELFVELNNNGLSIRTVNASKSAFASFLFQKEYFSKFRLLNNQNGNENLVIEPCKLSSQSFVGIFKNMKQVENCTLMFNLESNKLVIEMKCRFDIIRKYEISIIDDDALESTLAARLLDNQITGTYKIFTEVSNIFQMAEEEITLDADVDALTIKNYVKGIAIDPKYMKSQLTLRSNEFMNFVVKEKVSITFCLREFRAILGFIESMNENMTVNFTEAGQPVDFVIKSANGYEAILIMSTLSPDDLSFVDEPIERNLRNRSSRESNNISQNVSERSWARSSEKCPSENINVQVESNKQTVNNHDIIASTSEGLPSTFQSTERENFVGKSLPRLNERTRVVFKRCFESTESNSNQSDRSKILALDSDEE